MRSNCDILVGSEVSSHVVLMISKVFARMNFRILAVGWNNHVVEFPDTHENDVSLESDWITCHGDDVFAAAVRNPEVSYQTHTISFNAKNKRGKKII